MLSSYTLPRRRFLSAALFLSAAIVAPTTARAITLQPGDLLIGANIGASPTSFDYGILEIDPTTGNRTIISDLTTGTGPNFSFFPTAITFAPDGSLLVASDQNDPVNGGELLRIDPTTGNRTLVSLAFKNSGPISGYVGALYVDNTILMSGGPIVSVDPSTGDRTLVSGTGQGVGPAINSEGFAPSGANLFVANATLGSIISVDTTTGNRATISSATVGTGPSLNSPVDVVIDAAGKLIVNNNMGPLLSIDPVTGNRSIVSSDSVGTGPSLAVGVACQLAIASDGTIYTAQSASFAVQFPILAIDPLTGNRTIVSQGSHGTGPLFTPGFALAIVPTPEPSTLILAALGGLALLAMHRRRGF
ncbi:MAG TPA: PEP-CTERM sorting domain-containing protein [Pirellulales bacterium]|nr:PEP-CTERM sorting domain-containing protein [Pirellulales bacterium]